MKYIQVNIELNTATLHTKFAASKICSQTCRIAGRQLLFHLLWISSSGPRSRLWSWAILIGSRVNFAPIVHPGFWTFPRDREAGRASVVFYGAGQPIFSAGWVGLHIYSNGKETIRFPCLQKRKLSYTLEKTCLKIALSTFAIFKQGDTKFIAGWMQRIWHPHNLVYGKWNLLLSLLAK